MPEVRIENEIKMYSPGGVFSYDGDDPVPSMNMLLRICEAEGFTHPDPVGRKHTDFYYSDTAGNFDKDNILLRYRDCGCKAFLTVKLPTIRNGLGLSRREIEGEILNDSRFDRWKSVQGYANEVYGPVEIDKIPRLKVEVVRGKCLIRSRVHAYDFSFDRMVYTDPKTGRRSLPCYELEFELIDKAIADDPQMTRLVSVLEDTYLFHEERISKYARGMAFVRNLSR